MENYGEYSFSTCWNIKRHKNGRDLIGEILDLGFRNVELNYNVTESMMEDIEPMIVKGEIRVSSVHNVFPYIADRDYDTDSVLLGFDDETKRKRAVELLIRSMKSADRYGAKAVVVHPGEVPFDYNIDKELKRIYQEAGRDSSEYRTLWEEMKTKRDRHARRYCCRIRDSLEEASDYAVRKGWKVAIGIETRSRCYQIPTLMEAKWICDELKGSPVKLWYDIGHAMMMDRMGLYSNRIELPELLPYIYGVHIHETLGLSDHWCPYVHSKDKSGFDPFLSAIEVAEVKVYELKGVCTGAEIASSHRLITERLDGRMQ
ncbi:Xylose isomerase-like TIM barrel [compost metagenome]